MIAMVDSLNCIQDDFLTTDSLGGNRSYSNSTPIFLANNYYRAEVYQYNGRYLHNCIISGRNSEEEPWEIIYFLGDMNNGQFISPKDYNQVKFSWNKKSPETGTRISYWIRPDTAYHKDVFVSNAGDDSNPGTNNYPYKTIAKALSMKPKNIYLQKGDIFYETVTIKNVNLKAYGKGERPLLSGLKILPVSAFERGNINSQMKWYPSEDGFIWRINLAMAASEYDGFKVSSSIYNNIGTLVDLRTNLSLNCLRVQNVNNLLSLSRNWTLWQPYSPPPTTSTPSDFNYLYVYFEGNLKQYRLGVTVGTTCLIAQDCNIEGVKIAYWGRHGIQAGSNLIVRDCEIDCIGGMIQIGYPTWVCLGNGIEFYLSESLHDSLVEHCVISHCYDAGLTIQGSAEGKLYASNIMLLNNTIRNCCQSYEEFLRGNTEDSVFKNCIFGLNESYNAGIDTGFEYDDSRYKRCHILSNSNKRNTRMIYRNNVFENGNFRCSGPYIDNGKPQYNQGVWAGNTCKIRLGYDLIGDYIGKNDVISLPSDKGDYPTIDDAVNNAIDRYRQLTNDKTTRFEIF